MTCRKTPGPAHRAHGGTYRAARRTVYRTAVLYYVAKVERAVAPGLWAEVASEEGGVSFVLADATGRAIVDPQGAAVELDFDARSRTSMFDAPPASIPAFLARFGKTPGWLTLPRLRYREAILSVDEEVSVIGAGVRGGSRSASGERDSRTADLGGARAANACVFPLLRSPSHRSGCVVASPACAPCAGLSAAWPGRAHDTARRRGWIDFKVGPRGLQDPS